MSTMPVLTFAPLDVDAHRDFLLAAHHETSTLTFGTPFTAEQIAQQMERQRLFGTGAFLDDTIVGLCDMEIRGDDTPYGWVRFLFLAPHFRGQGLGVQLITHAEQVCRQNNLGKLFLRVGAVNQNAYDFYLHNGFVPAPQFDRPGEYGLCKEVL